MSENYPSGSVNFLLETDAVTRPTAKALNDRLEQKDLRPTYFDDQAFLILKTVTRLLFNQTEQENTVEIAAFIDDRLAKGLTDGWRYNEMPPDDQMYLKGLKGIDETSTLMFNKVFVQLTEDQQIRVMNAVQDGKAGGQVWIDISSPRFFEELLAEATEIFYAHPAALEEIDYTGMADAYGWKKLGLNEVEYPPITKKITL